MSKEYQLLGSIKNEDLRAPSVGFAWNLNGSSFKSLEKSLNFILNVAGNLKLKFGAIQTMRVKGP